MHHADIFCLLMKKNVTLSSIAEEEEVSPSFVSKVVRGEKISFTVATNIAAKISRSLNTLWPDKYNHSPRPLRRPSAQDEVAA